MCAAPLDAGAVSCRHAFRSTVIAVVSIWRKRRQRSPRWQGQPERPPRSAYGRILLQRGENDATRLRLEPRPIGSKRDTSRESGSDPLGSLPLAFQPEARPRCSGSPRSPFANWPGRLTAPVAFPAARSGRSSQGAASRLIRRLLFVVNNKSKCRWCR